MKTASTPLTSFLNSARQAIQFDLWTFTLDSGTVVRWTDADIDVTVDTRTFTRGAILTRDRIKWVRGVEVDTCRVVLAGPSVLVDGQALPVFAAAGGLDAASAQLERVYLDSTGTVQGSLVWFVGVVADVYPGRMGCNVVLKSPLTQLSQQLPRNLYQAGCLNDLYDGNCGINRTSYTVTGTVSAVGSGSNPVLTVTLGGGGYARFYELGAFKFTSGANVGLARTVQAQPVGGTVMQMQFARPFPFAIAVGDTFSLVPGCDKTASTCAVKFNNLLRFRGQPYVPVPETVT